VNFCARNATVACALRLEGGLLVEWSGHHEAMLCLAQDDEEPQDKETKNDHDAWFFVVSRAALPDAPASAAPQCAPAYGLIIASWSRVDKTYVLATRGAQATLERLLSEARTVPLSSCTLEAHTRLHSFAMGRICDATERPPTPQLS
jgi:hypothetical protein